MNHSFHNIEILSDAKPATIFLPGWGFDGRILSLLKPLPHWIFPETLLDPATFEQDLLQLAAAKDLKKFRLIGWSLGAMLGLEFAARHPDLIDSLILVSLREKWPSHEIKEIRAEFSREPKTFLKGFYRKCFLGDKPAYRNFCATLEPGYLAAANTNSGRLQRGLDFLGTYTLPSRLPAIPTRLVHGRQDIIAPADEMATLPETVVEIIDNAGHAVFLHQDCSLQHELKKEVIQAKFSKAAGSYDKFAKVQAEVATMLAAKLPPSKENPAIGNILEIGCGTGNFTALLAGRFPAAKIVALDFSPEMIEQARAKLPANNIAFACAEAEDFLAETPGKSYDLVASNGSLQWFSDIDRALDNIGRILRPSGGFFCSIFGPGSLPELASGLRAILGLERMLAAETFPNMDRLRDILQAYFKNSIIEEELLSKEYASAHDLLLHIKKTGTSGWSHTMQHPLTPSRVNQLDDWFKKTYGSCKVTYQILFLKGNM